MLQYRLAADRYSQAVRDRMKQGVTTTEYKKLTQLMERAHLECELARIAVEKAPRKVPDCEERRRG